MIGAAFTISVLFWVISALCCAYDGDGWKVQPKLFLFFLGFFLVLSLALLTGNWLYVHAP